MLNNYKFYHPFLTFNYLYMGRLKKYYTKEEKKESIRLKSKRYYWKNKEKIDAKAKARYHKNKLDKKLS